MYTTSGLTVIGAGLLVTAAALAQLRPAQTFLLIGPPGSGKSVQAGLLSKTYKVPAISMESLMQQELGKKNPLARALAVPIASGELVSDDAANELMKTRLLRPDAGRGFILDGYPATNAQADALDGFLEEHGFPKPVVVVLDAPDSLLRERMKSRKRADDQPEIIERRLQEYRQIEKLTVERYGANSTVRVDGSGSVQAVSARIAAQIENARANSGVLIRRDSSGGLKKRDTEASPVP